MQIDDYIVNKNNTIVEVMKSIEKNTRGIVYVCEHDRKLLGVITDGDVRRAIIRTGRLDAKAHEIMVTEPITISESQRDIAIDVMNKHYVRSVPVLDDTNKLIEIRFIDKPTIETTEKINSPVVIMAGGKGVRLQPYTNILPKPLIPIGDKTITEHIIDRFVKNGCHCFDIIVNYKKHFIKSYFRDLEREDPFNIAFVEEDEYLGTAGGLRMLQGRYNEAFFMTNCDILVEADYSKIMKQHKKNNNLATIVCALKNTTLPYGVIELKNDGLVATIREKPEISAMVNTGFYVLEPEFLDKIPEGQISQITDVFQSCINEGLNIGIYPIAEDKWMDMGQMNELKKMIDRLEDIR